MNNVKKHKMGIVDPQQKLVTQEDIAQLLYLWNNHGMDWRYRDMGLITTEEKYSELQKEYFLLLKYFSARCSGLCTYGICWNQGAPVLSCVQ